MKKANTSGKKYIPPQLRQQQDTTVNTDNSVTPATEKTPRKQHLPHFFSAHASIRQEQRKITSKAINKTVSHGEKIQSKESTTHLDESTQVVLGKNGYVITVQDNKRNTKFNLLNESKEREKMLLQEVQLKANDYAMCELAEIYLNGNLGNRQVQKAYTLLLRAAEERRNSHAMCLLAKLYEEGDLGAIDLEKAQQWLEKAADRNNKYALAVLGQRFLQKYLRLKESNEEDENKKQLLEQLLQKTMSYLQRSAAKGSTRAMWQIAKIYEEGWDGEKNMTKAIKHYCKAAKLGSPSSIYDLQRLVTEGKFVLEDFEAILDQASQLIAKTSSGLAVEIGLAQIQGKLGTNPQRGFKMLEQAAQKNNEQALITLAKCYRDGIGCTTDLTLSQYWFKRLKALYEKAVKLGNINAMLDLGNLYLKGVFGEIDLENAEKLFIHAAEQDDTFAIYRLGSLYVEGRLGDHDPAKGIFWLNKAIAMWSEQALSGDIEAINSLVELYLDKELGHKNYQKAAQWLSVLVTTGNKQSLSCLMSLYLKKKISLKDNEIRQIFSQEIIMLIKKQAIERKNPKALQVLAEWYREGYLAEEEKTDNINPWAQKLENLLFKDAQYIAEAALKLAILSKQEEGLLAKNLQRAAKNLCLASHLTYSNKINFIAYQELRAMLNSNEWIENENEQILAGILEYANQAEKEKPYRVGRILGDIYFKGKLNQFNVQEAFNWYTIAAKINNFKAMYRLGILHQTGVLGAVDLDAAIKCFEIAAKNGNQKAAQALVELGQFNKLAAELNTPKISTLEKQTRDKDILEKGEIYYRRGKQYQEGCEGNPKDPVQTSLWFHKAVAKSHAEAAFELAQLYNSEQLGKKVRPVAVSFFKFAAKRKHLGAIKALINVYSEGVLTEANPEKVLKWQKRETRLKK